MVVILLSVLHFVEWIADSTFFYFNCVLGVNLWVSSNRVLDGRLNKESDTHWVVKIMREIQ